VAIRLDPDTSEILGRVAVKESSSSMTAEVKRPSANFSRNSTASFRAAVRDALNLAPFSRPLPKGTK
jgi:hypothetical protein